MQGESEFVPLRRGLTLYGLPLLIATPPARETASSHRGRIFLPIFLRKFPKDCQPVQSLTA
nr:MAG TPA: hypothetical protein [Caudoviricetes sp.]